MNEIQAHTHTHTYNFNYCRSRQQRSVQHNWMWPECFVLCSFCGFLSPEVEWVMRRCFGLVTVIREQLCLSVCVCVRELWQAHNNNRESSLTINVKIWLNFETGKTQLDRNLLTRCTTLISIVFNGSLTFSIGHSPESLTNRRRRQRAREIIKVALQRLQLQARAHFHYKKFINKYKYR